MTPPHPTAPHTDDSAGGDTAVPERPTEVALPLRSELLRKGLHLVALVIPAGMYLFEKTWTLALLMSLTLLALGADVLRSRSPRFSRLILSIFGRMMRPRELSAPGGRPVVNGATWVLVAATLLTLMFPRHLAAPAFAAFMVADAAAAVIGLRFGRRAWPRTHRTVEGSLAFVAAALVCLLAVGRIAPGPAAAAALAGAAVEAPDWPVNDNVRVPLVMAGVLFLWGNFA